MVGGEGANDSNYSLPWNRLLCLLTTEIELSALTTTANRRHQQENFEPLHFNAKQCNSHCELHCIVEATGVAATSSASGDVN